MSVCLIISVYLMHLVPGMASKGNRAHVTGVTESYELSTGFMELNLRL